MKEIKKKEMKEGREKITKRESHAFARSAVGHVIDELWHLINPL